MDGSSRYVHVEIGSSPTFFKIASVSAGAMFFFRLRSLLHSGAQPCGQVGSAAVGVKQLGAREIGPWSSQQMSPTGQQVLPQQIEFGAQSSTLRIARWLLASAVAAVRCAAFAAPATDATVERIVLEIHAAAAAAIASGRARDRADARSARAGGAARARRATGSARAAAAAPGSGGTSSSAVPAAAAEDASEEKRGDDREDLTILCAHHGRASPVRSHCVSHATFDAVQNMPYVLPVVPL